MRSPVVFAAYLDQMTSSRFIIQYTLAFPLAMSKILRRLSRPSQSSPLFIEKDRLQDAHGSWRANREGQIGSYHDGRRGGRRPKEQADAPGCCGG